MTVYIHLDKLNMNTPKGVIEEQWKLRKKMQAECVGWLYPSILEDEITKLADIYSSILEKERKEMHGL